MAAAPDALRTGAEDFATRLIKLLNATVTSGTSISVIDYGAAVVITPGTSVTGRHILPLSTARSRPKREQAKLWLKLFYRMQLDEEGEYPAVMSSGFGLCVNPQTGFCPVRVEYDRTKTAKQQAHLQIHGESAGLSYATGLLGRPLVTDLSKLHFPSGGRRFRPTIEDFIEFLAQEALIPTPKTGWRQAIAEGRVEWEHRQTLAAVRRDPAAAVEGLGLLGYGVTPP